MLERRSDGKPGAQLSLPTLIFPSVSGNNIDAAASPRLAFCLKLQHRPRYTFAFGLRSSLIMLLETDAFMDSSKESQSRWGKTMGLDRTGKDFPGPVLFRPTTFPEDYRRPSPRKNSLDIVS